MGSPLAIRGFRPEVFVRSKAGVVSLACFLNAVAFATLTSIVGGTAAGGKIMGSHFYLGDNGKFVEVSRAMFIFSQIHSASLFVTLPIGVLAYWMASHYLGEVDAAKAARANRPTSEDV